MILKAHVMVRLPINSTVNTYISCSCANQRDTLISYTYPKVQLNILSVRIPKLRTCAIMCLYANVCMYVGYRCTFIFILASTLDTETWVLTLAQRLNFSIASIHSAVVIQLCLAMCFILSCDARVWLTLQVTMSTMPRIV